MNLPRSAARRRTTPEVDAALQQLRPFARAGYILMPLLPERTPRDKGWTSADYSSFNPRQWVARGSAVGVRLAPGDLVIDIDPRNGGQESFERLCADVGVRLDQGAPRVLTGGGGVHLYYRKPPDLRVHSTMAQYLGIDFKHAVGYVVAAGSVHDRTHQLYRFDEASPAPADVPMAPAALLALLERPAPRDRTGSGGEVTNEELAGLLAVIDAQKYAEYSAWLAISAAVHDATDGYGLHVWADWCRSDPNYADVDDEYLALKWDSFEAGRAGGATYRSLFKAVSKAGRSDLLRQLGASIDFDHQPDELEFGAPEPLDLEHDA